MKKILLLSTLSLFSLNAQSETFFGLDPQHVGGNGPLSNDTYHEVKISAVDKKFRVTVCADKKESSTCHDYEMDSPLSSKEFASTYQQLSETITLQQTAINNTEKEVAKGMNFASKNGQFNSKLGDTVTFSGDDNISVKTENNTVSIQLSDNPVFGGTVSANGLKIAENSAITMGNNVVSQVANGSIAQDSKDAINGGQIYALSQTLVNHLGGNASIDSQGKITAPTYEIKDLRSGKTLKHHSIDQALGAVNKNVMHVQKEAYAGTATALASSALGQSFKPNQSSLGIASALYQGQVAYALGGSYLNHSGKLLLKASLSSNHYGHVGLAVGATYYFD